MATVVTLPLLLAHVDPAGVGGPRGWNELLVTWTVDPSLLAVLLATAWLYRRGGRALRTSLAKAAAGRRSRGGLRRWEVACFWGGWWTLVLALFSPLHPWGRVLFSAHMTQHELLMLVAAPLLVLGRPLVAFLFAIPRGDARMIAQVVRESWLRRAWEMLSRPLVAWTVHAFALWIWHVPKLYEATLRNEFLHHVQHSFFFGTALLFWWAIMESRAGLRGCGVAVLYLFTTMMHSGLLGALILFAGTLVYPTYAATAPDWSLTPLEDQQLGGLIMWVPAGLIYVGATLALLAGWMRRAEPPASRVGAWRAAQATALLLGLCVLPACSDRRWDEAAARTGGDPHAGARRIQELGCGACHTIPGISGARGQVGPSLDGIATRNYIGGVLPNDPANMKRWLMDPSAHSPRTVMPKLVADEHDARDIAAYLSTLRAR